MDSMVVERVHRGTEGERESCRTIVPPQTEICGFGAKLERTSFPLVGACSSENISRRTNGERREERRDGVDEEERERRRRNRTNTTRRNCEKRKERKKNGRKRMTMRMTRRKIRRKRKREIERGIVDVAIIMTYS